MILPLCSYIVKSGVIYLCLADAKYPQKLAFMFLQDISKSFYHEL
jgi:Regulated-SNARE-like domain